MSVMQGTVRSKRLNERAWRGAVDRELEGVGELVRPEHVNLLWQADGGTRTRVAAQLQRQAGNRFVRDLVQRQVPPVVPPVVAAPLTDAQQWDQDWTNFSAQQTHFKATGRPSGTPRQRYDILCPLYKAHGIPRPMVYLDTFITTAHFYQFSTPAHTNLATALAAAETTLKGQGHKTAPVKSVWALNARTTSKGGWSNHADGKAVDIDPNDNPHLVDKTERKIIGLVTGTDMNKGAQGFNAMKGASDKFKADYNAAGMQQRVTDLGAVETTKTTERDTAKAERDVVKAERDALKSERAALKKQLQAVPKGKKATAADAAQVTALTASVQQKEAELKKKEADLKQKEAELKKKEAELKDATRDRELLQKQLASFQAMDKAISDLEASVASLPGEINALNDQIVQSKQAEKDAQDAKDSKGVVAQQKLRVKLQQALKQKDAALEKQKTQVAKKKTQRDADPLRTYAAGGFLNLSKDVVDALTGARLKWGGNWEGAKDFMHFEL